MLTVIIHSVLLLASSFSTLDNSEINLGDITELLRGDVRIIAIGDSMTTAFWPRTLTSGLRVWPIQKISAIGGGAGLGPALIRCSELCSPFENVVNPDPLGYQVERQNQNVDYFALPIRGIKEIFTDDSFSSLNDIGNLFELNLNDDEFESSVHGPFASEGDNLRFRLLYRAPIDISQQPTALKLRDAGEDVLTFNPQTDARKMYHLGQVPDGDSRLPISSQINAVSTDIPANNQLGQMSRVYLAEDYDLSGTNVYFNLAGGVYYHADEKNNPIAGIYFTSIADDGWRYEGFYRDALSKGTHDKSFTKNQFIHWLDVTTLRLEQPLLFVWTLNNEINTTDQFKVHFENMIQQAQEAASQVGLEEVYHLIITSQLHLLHGGTLKLSTSLMLKHQEAAQIVANEHNNVVAFSLYEATDGVLFDGSQESILWLEDHGFSNFEFGVNQINLVEDHAHEILDSYLIHPGSNEGAAFFAAIMGNEFRKSMCPADFITDGVIDVNDLLALLDGWGDGGQGDINGDGTTDVNDLLLLLGQWGDCWPVQAPFSTGQFE